MLLDARTGERRRTLRGHAGLVHALRFAPEGGLLASTSQDQTAIVWDVADAFAPQHTLDLGDGEVQGLAFDDDGGTLYTAGADRAIRVWDLTGGQRFLTEVTAAGRVRHRVGLPVARRRPTPSTTTSTEACASSTTPPEPPPTSSAPATESARERSPGTPTGSPVASTAAIWVWDPATGKLIADNRDHPGDYDAWDMAYTADGSRIVVADERGRLYLVDAETLDQLGAPVEVGTWACCVSAGSDNRTSLVVVSDRPREILASNEFAFGGDEWVRVDLEAGRVLSAAAQDSRSAAPCCRPTARGWPWPAPVARSG